VSQPQRRLIFVPFVLFLQEPRLFKQSGDVFHPTINHWLIFRAFLFLLVLNGH